MTITTVRKRTGDIVPFDAEKITVAIQKAMLALGLTSRKKAEFLSKKIVESLNSKQSTFFNGIPTIEQIQETVEEVLEQREERVYKAYSLYRRSRGIAREIKQYFKIHDDLKLDVNALKVLEERYLLRDETGKIIETPTQLFRRVAKTIAEQDALYGKDPNRTEEAFFTAMRNLEFLPNSPTLMNAGTKLGQLSACFVLPIEDSLEGIFSSLKNMALIQQSGGGTGFSFSRLREKGAIVKSTKGVASGPISFMRIYDSTTEVIKQGGKRRGANIGILHCTHPDIPDFVTAKSGKRLTNFNISVAVTDSFMRKVLTNKVVVLRSPKTGKVVQKINAADLFELIVRNAWETGDPGLLFIDEINRKNPLRQTGLIEATNPCGEVPLLAYESCNLGSINLVRMIKNGKLDWKKLRATTRLAVHFLDNVIDANNYPLKETEKITKAHRKIGLGVMGFADLLFMLKTPYDSKEALQLGERLIRFVAKEAREKSVELGKQRGSFMNFQQSIWQKKYPAMRNATCITIAPTGTISIVAGCSSGIEPVFALAFLRRVMDGKHLPEVNETFKRELIRRDLYSDELIRSISKTGNIKSIKLPADLKKIFVTSLDIAAEIHVRMQAAFQRHVDNAVSKTVNLPKDSSPEDVRNIYLLAWKLKCKGITVYRYGSKPEQVLYLGTGKPIVVTTDFAGGCPTGLCPL
ncbi:MAG TPA: adenosylcobalamin-dependent ribonucleoside-diphosphate reductase [Thermoplasmata archaeon]|jgi:ribonucleoside-diphosphate reductase alpha chain|nr:MAG TPA: adenosylcobalamin-dependent ribonucleoside-diphosphate reductase [Thermoplasmata archaeon]